MIGYIFKIYLMISNKGPYGLLQVA